MSGCPVDHNAQKRTESCPVDHGALSHQSSESSSLIWSRLFSSQPKSFSSAPQPSVSQLSTERVLSSIPKARDGNWVYPSEAQFFAAMDRKNHNPQAADMKTIVPIHNAVNERAWTEIMKWEAGRGGEACGGVKLVNFKGRPGDLSPKARCKSFLGYAAPFDRHDWIVDRCGTRTRYIIDFYTGRSEGAQSTLSFYLDVRPALDNWEGVKMRVSHFWGSWWQNSRSSTPKATS
ncbi:cytochrome c and c1 heme-lyase [Guyanagaster necrorhizus]|uniref:Holocytochrome c-type synthase n=1 Tax=Guyanagaster necrorhizus TaxID=856835 RepID=A0A9P8AYU0_9AGAR|nr:cytochrome c and c1 heme-lyase [Guyanagaster necrorhizus MCA 3950]KAG7452855.1 cytochrome c and c1 heme-lyase [Guyanagaster necrorhizus MCA 3950]